MLGEVMDFNKVGGIERGLGYFMTPIDPDPEFIRKLGSRLLQPKVVTMEGGSSPKPVAIVILLAGFIIGIVSFFVLRRVRRLH